MLALTDMLNANMLTVDPLGDFCVHWGTFTFSEAGEAFLQFVHYNQSTQPIIVTERLMDWLYSLRMNEIKQNAVYTGGDNTKLPNSLFRCNVAFA